MGGPFLHSAERIVVATAVEPPGEERERRTHEGAEGERLQEQPDDLPHAGSAGTVLNA